MRRWRKLSENVQAEAHEFPHGEWSSSAQYHSYIKTTQKHIIVKFQNTWGQKENSRSFPKEVTRAHTQETEWHQISQ